MHMLRFRLTEPCTKTMDACVDLSSKTTLNAPINLKPAGGGGGEAGHGVGI